MNKKEKAAAAQERFEVQVTNEIKQIKQRLIDTGVISKNPDVPMVYAGAQITDYMLASGGIDVLIEEEKDLYLDAKEFLQRAKDEYKYSYTPFFKTRLYHAEGHGIKFALAAFPIGPINEGN